MGWGCGVCLLSYDFSLLHKFELLVGPIFRAEPTDLFPGFEFLGMGFFPGYATQAPQREHEEDKPPTTIVRIAGDAVLGEEHSCLGFCAECGADMFEKAGLFQVEA